MAHKMHITLAAIAKDEAPYIVEWIAHHRSLGFDKIIVLNNGSTDQTGEILAILSHHGIIESKDWIVEEGISPQMSGYNHIMNLNSELTDMIAFIDLDEFIIETSTKKFRDVVIDAMSPSESGAIVINQRVFGSNGYDTAINYDVLNRFSLGSESDYLENEWVKTIYRTSAVEKITNSHSSPLKHGHHVHPNGSRAVFKDDRFASVQIEHSLLQLNHYITKSLEEFMKKKMRGGVMAARESDRKGRYADDGFFRNRQYGTNTCSDAGTERASRDISGHVERLLKDAPELIKAGIYSR